MRASAPRDGLEGLHLRYGLCRTRGQLITDDAWVRLPAADRGHDLQWLVDTGGDLDADPVARTMGNLIGAMVSSTPVNAPHPDSDAFGDMVAVRVPTDRAAAVRALAASDMGLTIAGRRCHCFFRSRSFARVGRGSGTNPGRRRESLRPRQGWLRARGRIRLAMVQSCGGPR